MLRISRKLVAMRWLSFVNGAIELVIIAHLSEPGASIYAFLPRVWINPQIDYIRGNLIGIFKNVFSAFFLPAFDVSKVCT
jgi:hypothetical protein